MNPSPTPGNAATVETVVDLVRGHSRRLELESITLDQALGRIVAEEVLAGEDMPAFDRSAMDGFAIPAQDASLTFTVVDRIRAGEWKPRALQPGQAVQVATGAALPGAALQVIIKEDAQLEGDQLRILRRTEARHIRFRGEDARQGQVLVHAGTIMNPGVLALLASLGKTSLETVRYPKVLHLATGNELVSPEETPRTGQIRDSNSTLVRAFLQQLGITPEQQRLPEDEAAVNRWLGFSKLNGVDLLLVSGGASVGEHDFTAKMLRELGYTVHLCKTNTRPGKPLIFGSRGSAIAFGLPGNPLAHFVCLNLYVRAALEKMHGVPARKVFLAGRLGADLNSDECSRETLWPAQAELTAQGMELLPLRWSSSGDITALARANALLRVPAGCRLLQRHAAVEWAAT